MQCSIRFNASRHGNKFGNKEVLAIFKGMIPAAIELALNKAAEHDLAKK